MSFFDGFPKEIGSFFEDLKRNNTKEWFQDHRDAYESYVKRPSEEFVLAMGEKLQTLSSRINAIPKVNQSLFRINRDTRFSHDKSPYKTNLGIWFWEGQRKRMECPGFYFHMADGKLMLGVGMYKFPGSLLKRYRDAVVDKELGPVLKRTVNRLTKNGYTIGTRHYKRVPRDYDASHENAQYLLFNGLTAMVEEEIPDAFYSPAIADHAFSHYRVMSPIHEWLLKAI